MRRLPGAAVVIILAVTLMGCRSALHADTIPLLPPSDERPSDEPLYLAKLHFRHGDYGLAEEYYRRAVEANRDSLDAWLGLAATYDRLNRFDLAENAYRTLIAKIGYTPVVLNNLGYHYLLEGRIEEARKYLMQARQKDPNNPEVLSNLALLDQWSTAPGGARR
jgi:Flp pilus assembly protein TadD